MLLWVFTIIEKRKKLLATEETTFQSGEPDADPAKRLSSCNAREGSFPRICIVVLPLRIKTRAVDRALVVAYTADPCL